MTKLPPGEGEPTIERVAEAQEPKQEPKSLAVEDLKKRRADLEGRVEKAKLQKAEDIKKRLSDREAMITENKRLVPMIEEARDTLEYFETQEQQGLLNEPKDLEELKSLRELVSSLEQQREDTLRKYDAIMSSPDVETEVLKEAQAEHGEREFKGEFEKAQAELEKGAHDLYNQMENYVHRLMESRQRRETAERDLLAIRGKIREIVGKAWKSSDSGETYFVLQDFNRPGFLERLNAQRKKLGLFAGKEKAAIDYVVVRNNQTVSELERDVFNLQKAYTEEEDVHHEVDTIAETYKYLLLEVWKKQNELQAKFPDKREDLVFNTDRRIDKYMEAFADIKRSVVQGNQTRKVGKYDGWFQANFVPKNRAMGNLKKELEDKTGTLRYNNPEKSIQ